MADEHHHHHRDRPTLAEPGYPEVTQRGASHFHMSFLWAVVSLMVGVPIDGR
jgi:hypothetical protein